MRVECAVLRVVYAELVRQEKETGVYRTRIAAAILTEHLIGGIAQRELADVRFDAINGYKMVLLQFPCEIYAS
jgi:hypothetical protein